MGKEYTGSYSYYGSKSVIGTFNLCAKNIREAKKIKYKQLRELYTESAFRNIKITIDMD